MSFTDVLLSGEPTRLPSLTGGVVSTNPMRVYKHSTRNTNTTYPTDIYSTANTTISTKMEQSTRKRATPAKTSNPREFLHDQWRRNIKSNIDFPVMADITDHDYDFKTLLADYHRPVNFTAVEIIVFLPRLFLNEGIARRFANNNIQNPEHMKILQLHRRILISTNTIGAQYRAALQPYEVVDGEEKYKGKNWNRKEHKVPLNWDHESIAINDFVPDRILRNRTTVPEPPSVPFRSLMDNVYQLPAYEDAADLTRAVRFVSDQPDQAKDMLGHEPMFPDDLTAVLGHLGHAPPQTQNQDKLIARRYRNIDKSELPQTPSDQVDTPRTVSTPSGSESNAIGTPRSVDGNQQHTPSVHEATASPVPSALASEIAGPPSPTHQDLFTQAIHRAILGAGSNPHAADLLTTPPNKQIPGPSTAESNLFNQVHQAHLNFGPPARPRNILFNNHVPPAPNPPNTWQQPFDPTFTFVQRLPALPVERLPAPPFSDHPFNYIPDMLLRDYDLNRQAPDFEGIAPATFYDAVLFALRPDQLLIPWMCNSNHVRRLQSMREQENMGREQEEDLWATHEGYRQREMHGRFSALVRGQPQQLQMGGLTDEDRRDLFGGLEGSGLDGGTGFGGGNGFVSGSGPSSGSQFAPGNGFGGGSSFASGSGFGGGSGFASGSGSDGGSGYASGSGFGAGSGYGTGNHFGGGSAFDGGSMFTGTGHFGAAGNFAGGVGYDTSDDFGGVQYVTTHNFGGGSTFGGTNDFGEEDGFGGGNVVDGTGMNEELGGGGHGVPGASA